MEQVNPAKSASGTKVLLFTDISHCPQTHCSGWGAALTLHRFGQQHGEMMTASGFIRSRPYRDTVLAELSAAELAFRWALDDVHLLAGDSLRLVLDNRLASKVLRALSQGRDLDPDELIPAHLDITMDVASLRPAAENLVRLSRDAGIHLEAGWIKGHSLAIGSPEWHQQGETGGGVLNTTAHLLARSALKVGLEGIIREFGLPYSGLPPKKRKSGRGKVLAHIARALREREADEAQTAI